MTDVATGQGGLPADSEWEDLPLVEVKTLFTTLGKAVRAYQLYDENNPVRQRFVDALRGDFRTLWAKTDRLVLRVTEEHFMLGETSVYHTENRNDSLAFLFFKDSVREATFLPGVEEQELVSFLEVLQKARKLMPEGDDLLTVLWEADLQFFSYQYVDLLAEGVSLPEAGPGNSPAEMQAVLAAASEEEEQGPPESGQAGAAEEQGPRTVSKDDFNPTLYALDPKEMEVLGGELKKELERDVRSDVVAALLDRLEEPGNRERQSEILEILKALLPSFLHRGRIGAVTQVLRELRALEDQEGSLDEQRLAECREVLDEISSPEVVTELIQSLLDGTISASAAPSSVLSCNSLGGGALAPLLRSSETVDHKELQEVLRHAVQEIAKLNPSAVVELLEDDDAVLAAGAVRLAGEMQITEAVPALVGLLAHADPAMRFAAIEAAISLKASIAADALEQTLDDPERDLRVAAARALGALEHRPAAKVLATKTESKETRVADISEKVAFFEAFGMVAGDDGVDLLDRLLNGKRFLGKREPTDIRSAAALGLGKIGSQAARAALDHASDDGDAVVRSNVGRALRGEGAE